MCQIRAPATAAGGQVWKPRGGQGMAPGNGGQGMAARRQKMVEMVSVWSGW